MQDDEDEEPQFDPLDAQDAGSVSDASTGVLQGFQRFDQGL